MPMESKESKILVLRSKGQNNQTGLVYALHSSGMIIGSVAGDQEGAECRFGEDGTQAQTRYFISLEKADLYIKDKIRAHVGRDDLDFLLKDTDPMIQPAANLRRM